jgi:hypothetical protein
MHSNQENVNYWPGFVDAIMNVLLNILFMLCIMAFGLGLVQDKVRQSANATADADSPDNPNKNLPPPLTRPTEETISTFPVSQIKLKATVTPSQVASVPTTSVSAKLNQPNVVSLEFTGQSPQMVQELKAHLQTYLPQIAQPSDDIVVWAVDNEEIPNSNKLLFRRLMAVRNALFESGIPSARIEVRMLTGETSKNTATVYLAPASHSP